jgi:phage terminase large subunit
MNVEFNIEPNAKQAIALEMLGKDTMYTLLYGGSRSGKTFLFLYAIIVRALKVESKHLIVRNHFTDIKKSIWNETLPKLLNLLPDECYKCNNQDFVVKFANGSKIWIGGLDDKQRVDKILGNEYSTIFFNESSEISSHAVTTALTRLAEKTDLINKVFFDCNPPTKLHWIYKWFINKTDPESGLPLKNRNDYQSLRINPEANKDNLPDTYFRILDGLPEKKRKRFRDGLFTDVEGLIFTNYKTIAEKDIPPIENYAGGIDFGLNMAGIKVGWAGDIIYVLKECEAFHSTTNMFNQKLFRIGWHNPIQILNYCDPAGTLLIPEITGGCKADNAVEPGIDFIQTLIEQNRFFINENCTGLLAELDDYKTNEKGQIIKKNDHLIDAMRYAVYSNRIQFANVLAVCHDLSERERPF